MDQYFSFWIKTERYVFRELTETNHRQETYKSDVVSKTVNLDAQQPLAILRNAEVFEYKLSGERQSELLSLWGGMC